MLKIKNWSVIVQGAPIEDYQIFKNGYDKKYFDHERNVLFFSKSTQT